MVGVEKIRVVPTQAVIAAQTFYECGERGKLEGQQNDRTLESLLDCSIVFPRFLCYTARYIVVSWGVLLSTTSTLSSGGPGKWSCPDCTIGARHVYAVPSGARMSACQGRYVDYMHM